MGALEWIIFVTASIFRLAAAVWLLASQFDRQIEVSLVTTLKLLAAYACVEVVIRAIENYARYRAVIIQLQVRRATKLAEAQARREAQLQFMQAQNAASEKYFDAKDMVLGRRSSQQAQQ